MRRKTKKSMPQPRGPEEREALSARATPGAPRSLGAAIRHGRRKREMTLEQIAQKTKLSVSYLSQVERDRMPPSLSSLKRIADALDVPAGSLMFAKGGARSDSLVAIVRQSARKRLLFPGSKIRYDMLTPDLQRRASMLWLNAPAGAESGPAPFSHEGEDAVVVLQGRLAVEVGGVWHELANGDSIYFNSQLPHRWRNPTNRSTIAIWMSTPPSF